MPRLPQPGFDEGTWGTILNDFLLAAHAADGSLKASSVTPAALSANTPASGQVLSYNGTTFAWITSPAGVTDHGLLSGLTDDDHPQYHTDARGDARYYTQAQVDSSLSGKANTAHTHAIADVTNLQTTLNGKEGALTAGTTAQYYRGDKTWQTLDKTAVGLANVDNTSDTNKPISTATQTALDAKAASSHTHVIADTTGLQTALDAKAATSHTHAAADIASGVLATARLGTGTADGTTFLRGDGTWATPPGGGSATWGSVTGTLSDQTDLQGALDGKAASSHTHAQADITNLTNDLAAKEPGVPVGTSAQYYRGDKTWQTLDKTAAGLANVDNTSDANKPISTATQTALDGKAPADPIAGLNKVLVLGPADPVPGGTPTGTVILRTL